MEENMTTTEATDTPNADVVVEKPSVETTTEPNTDSLLTDSSTEETVPSGAPEEYSDFTAPEGISFDAETSREFKSLAKEMNLTQEQAQKLADIYGKNVLDMQSQVDTQAKEWLEESKKVYKPADISLAKKALTRFANPEIVELLNVSGLGNHPQMIGLFKAIGQQISEGVHIENNNIAKPVSRMYPNSPDIYK